MSYAQYLGHAMNHYFNLGNPKIPWCLETAAKHARSSVNKRHNAWCLLIAQISNFEELFELWVFTITINNIIVVIIIFSKGENNMIFQQVNSTAI